MNVLIKYSSLILFGLSSCMQAGNAPAQSRTRRDMATISAVSLTCIAAGYVAYRLIGDARLRKEKKSVSKQAAAIKSGDIGAQRTLAVSAPRDVMDIARTNGVAISAKPSEIKVVAERAVNMPAPKTASDRRLLPVRSRSGKSELELEDFVAEARDRGDTRFISWIQSGRWDFEKSRKFSHVSILFYTSTCGDYQGLFDYVVKRGLNPNASFVGYRCGEYGEHTYHGLLSDCNYRPTKLLDEVADRKARRDVLTLLYHGAVPNMDNPLVKQACGIIVAQRAQGLGYALRIMTGRNATCSLGRQPIAMRVKIMEYLR